MNAEKIIIITTASWEERYLSGMHRLLDDKSPENIPVEVVSFFYREYSQKTKDNRAKIKKLCGEKKISFKEPELTFSSPAQSWKRLYETLCTLSIEKRKVIVDITTMPREAIWTAFNLLEAADTLIEYIYHAPQDYNEEWLSRDPAKPRIVYKLGGIARLGVPTNLLVLPGYDIDRVKQMITFFEPRNIFLGVQTGKRFKNSKHNAEKIKKEFEKKDGYKLFEIDAYSEDRGLTVIEQQTKPFLDSSNFILSSLGPKLSAVALYRFHKNHPETALAYAPSNEFNPQYSYGIGETIKGRL